MPAANAAIQMSLRMTVPPFTPCRAHRRALALPGRVTWKDSHGTTRFASVVTRDVSDSGAFIEWNERMSIPLYRLVTFQLEQDVRGLDGLPSVLRGGRILSAVYRIGTVRRSTGTPDGYGLRFLVEPSRASHTSALPATATA
jgi:hypothetical protein